MVLNPTNIESRGEWGNEDEMPPRKASKWDILSSVPFAGKIYDRSVQKKEAVRREEWQAEQAQKQEREQAKLAAEQERIRQDALRRQQAYETERLQRQKEHDDQLFIDGMDAWRLHGSPEARARNERRQELAERAFNDVFTPTELIAAEAEAGSSEVTASTTELDGQQLPVYTLHGRELCCLLHAIDFKGRGGQQDARRIGSATAVRLQDDPSFWDKGKVEVESRENGSADNANSTSGSLSTTFFDTTRNFSQVGNRNDIWDYGFTHLAPGSIVDISLGDGAFAQGQNTKQMRPNLTDSLITPDQIREKIGPVYHNEFYLNRYDEDGKALQPDFILTSSRDGSLIPDVVKRHAAYFGVPIFSIDQQAYREKEKVRVKEKLDSLSNEQSYEEMAECLDDIHDSYMASWPTIQSDNIIGHADRERLIEQQLNLPDITPERQQELLDLELKKKLEYVKRRLATETAKANQATLAGEYYPSYENGMLKVAHCDTIKSTAEFAQAPDLPTQAAPGHAAVLGPYRHRLDLKLLVNGKPRELQIHDGKHPAKTEFGPSATDDNTPDYYAEFAPLVDAYLAAVEENKQKDKASH